MAALPSGGLLARRTVGRAHELDALRRQLAAAADGTGSAVVLVGDPGAGKSHLVARVLTDARHDGLTVLSGRASDEVTRRPYRALSEALVGLLNVLGPAADGGATTAVRAAAARLEPAHQEGQALDPLAAGEGLLRALTVLGRRAPVLLCVEDVHWADADTMSVLGYVVDHVREHGAAVLLTSRPAGDEGGALHRLLDRRVLTALELGPLDEAEVDAMVLACLRVDAAPAELLDFVRDRARGSPFAVEELLAGLARSGAVESHDGQWRVVAPRLTTEAPATVAAAVRRRVEALGAHGRAVLGAAAMLGHRFDWHLLAPWLEMAERDVLDSLRAAVESGLLVEHGGMLAFRHALTKDEVLRLLLAPDRQRLAARALRLLRRGELPATPDRDELELGLAELAGDESHRRELLLRTGRRAAAQGALSTAVSRLGLAAATDGGASSVRYDALESLAAVQALAGDVDAAVQAGRAALAELDGHSEQATRRTRLHLVLARASLAAGRTAEAETHLARARSTASGPAVGALDALAAHTALEAGDTAAAALRARAVVDTHPPLPAEVRCEAFEVLGRAARLQDVRAAEEWFTLQLQEAAGSPTWRARALHELGTVDLLDTMRLERLQAARRAAVETGIPATLALADFHLAEALVARGETLSGRLAAERSAAIARRIGSPLLPWAWLTVARSYAHERDDPAMQEALRMARTFAPDDKTVQAGAHGRVLAMRELHGADARAALEHLDRAVALLRDAPDHHFPYRGLWLLLTAVHVPQGYAAAREVAVGAAGAGTRVNRAMVSAADAVVRGAEGERAGAELVWEEAMRDLRGYQCHDWYVHVCHWLVSGSALEHCWGHPVEAAQAAVRWFSENGHEPLATASRQFLKVAGAPVPRRGRGQSQVPHSLRARGVTSREVDVLALVGLRLSNNEIADRLVLSPRTVEKHISSLMQKTGSGDRRDLALLVEGLEPGPS